MSDNAERIVRKLIADTDISINGNRPWDVQVNNNQFYKRILRDASLGFGESYMDGWWDCERIDLLIEKILRSRLDNVVRHNWMTLAQILAAKLFNMQSIKRAFQVGEEHYDVGNDLYRLMLDKRMIYTCGYFQGGAKSLDEAQEAKLDLVCRKIGLQAGMTVLDLGCGWGGFAKFAAENYGARVTGMTVSKEQVKLGMELCKGLPVELLCEDYRSARGSYDRVISIGIMEHVGHKNYRSYMEVANRCLKDDGIAFVHTIGRNFSMHNTDPWLNKYIFPNGMNPSIKQLGEAMEGLFVMEDWHNFGEDYDKTLMAWYHNFQTAWPQLQHKYPQRFKRMWDYYLLFCAGGFKARHVQLWQIVMTKTGTPQPACRKS
jgi:cyclopropane-fatty-acyl-phospholipid synthase